MTWVLWLAFAIVGGLIGFAIGRGKEQSAFGFLLGFFFGFIGWIIVALLPEPGGPDSR